MRETKFTAELAGRIVAISKAKGDRIEPGDEVVVIESMKMEVPLTAQVGGVVTAVLVHIDDMIDEGQTLLIIDT